MAMVNTPPPKHKPNEKHALDEVLKSLNDLVHGNVLDKPRAPPAVVVQKPAAPAPITDMGDILKSLESLLDNDLSPHDKPAPPPPPATAKQPEPAISARPKPPAVIEPSPDPTNLLSEADIVKALEEISFDTDFASDAETAEAKPQIVESAAVQELDRITPEEISTPESIAEAPGAGRVQQAPPEPTSADAQNELFFDMSDENGTETPEEIESEIEAAPPPGYPDLELMESTTDVTAPPADTSGLEVLETTPNEMSLADELAAIDFSIDDLEPARAPSNDSFSIEFTPTKKSESVSVPVAGAETHKTEVAEIPASQEVEEIEAAAPVEEIEASLPVEYLSSETTASEAEIVSMSTEPSVANADENLTPPLPVDDYSDIIERAEPPTVTVGGSNDLGSLGEFMELDISGSDTVEFTNATLTEIGPDTVPDTVPPPAVGTAEVSPPIKDSITVALDEPTPSAEVADADVLPKVELAPPPKVIPVLQNVAVPTPADPFTLEPSPPIRPAAKKPELHSQDLHQTAVRVIAKLNIELRKSGKPPFDAKVINRLQQLLKEALESKKK